VALLLAAGAAAPAVWPAGPAQAAQAVTAARAEPLGDGPPGFWYGTDSWPVPVTGSAPYSEPSTGGAYGGYIGMTGSWSYWLGCKGGFLAWSSTNSAQADTDYTKYGKGIGTAVYWFMGGPGVDQNYNGSAAEASAWGARQAARALADAAGEDVTYPVLFMDIELPGVAPASDNGWNSVYTSACSGVVKQSGVPAAVDRADFNGFWGYVKAHSKYAPGVYSSAGIWASIFGTGDRDPVRRSRRLVPEGRRRLRPVLRRGHQRELQRPAVAVVRRRRRPQRPRRLRPDRREPPELTRHRLLDK
jgi:hypothetical protein